MMKGIGKVIAGVAVMFAGVAAIAGTSVTSAAASSVTYSASALQTNVQGVLDGISCPTAGSCVAVGAKYGGGELAETFSNGTWNLDTVSTGQTDPELNGVWCASSTSCVAVGEIDTLDNPQALVETLSGSSWSATTSGLSPVAATSSGLTAISCLSISSCFATGSYTDSSGDTHALFEELSNGAWTPSTAVDPGGSAFVLDESIHCFSTTSCLAVGAWSTNTEGTTTSALLETYNGITWTASTLGPAGDLLRSISCPSIGSCMAVGYQNSASEGVTETLSSGVWTRGLVPVPPGGSDSLLVGVSCSTTITACVAIGNTRVPPSNSYPDTLIETLTNGTWVPTGGIDPTTGYGYPEALSCPTQISCVGVGLIDGANQSVNPMGVVASVPPPPPPPHGYWLVGSDGGIFTFGSAQFQGSTGALKLQRPVVGITPTPAQTGYWLVGSDGGVFAFNAPFVGSLPGLGLHPAGSGLPNSLSKPIVGIVPSTNGQGYYMVASDGGVFAFNANFAGSCPGIGGCNGSAVAVAPDATGNGYWLVTATGLIYSFGDAPYLGGPGPQSSAITSMVRTPNGGGYYILDADGQVFAYGNANASLGGTPAGSAGGLDPATAIFDTADGGGYWITTALGKVYAFGDAPNDGDMSGSHLNGPIIAATGF